MADQPSINVRVKPGRTPTVTMVSFKFPGLIQVPVLMLATPIQDNGTSKKD